MRLCPCRPLHTYLLLAAPSPYSSSFPPLVSPSSTSSASPSRAMCAFYHAWQGNYRSQSGPRLHSTSSLPPSAPSFYLCGVAAVVSQSRPGQTNEAVNESVSQSLHFDWRHKLSSKLHAIIVSAGLESWLGIDFHLIFWLQPQKNSWYISQDLWQMCATSTVSIGSHYRAYIKGYNL